MGSKPRLPVSKTKHKWQLVSRSYAAPVRSYEGIHLEKLPKDMAEKMMLGVTTYLWECLLTNEIRKEEILGTDTQVLDELFLKVKQYGRQLLKNEAGETFVLDKYQEYVDPRTLPMRKV